MKNYHSSQHQATQVLEADNHSISTTKHPKMTTVKVETLAKLYFEIILVLFMPY